MKNFGKLKLFGLFVLFLAAWVFVGINLLDAQVEIARKGPKPRQGLSWTVYIPGSGSENNLYGHFPGTSNIYDDTGEEGDGILIDVLTGQGKKAETTLRLVVGNNIDDSGDCTDWENGPIKIGFQYINAVIYWISETINQECPCFFPPGFGGSVPGCMADFLNGLHPYCDPNCVHPECSYRVVEIKIKFNRHIKDITGVENPTGIVSVSLVNTYDLQTDCDEYAHNINGELIVEVPGSNFTITKMDVDNTWTVYVEGDFIFAEVYKGRWQGKGKKGKGSTEYKIPYRAQIPLKFETVWTWVPEE